MNIILKTLEVNAIIIIKYHSNIYQVAITGNRCISISIY